MSSDETDNIAEINSAVEANSTLRESDATQTGSVRKVAGAIGILLLGLLVALTTATLFSSGDVEAKSHLIGKPVPALKGISLEGEVVDIADSSGWVAVNFFGPFCVGCRLEHPELTIFNNWAKQTGKAELIAVVFDTDDLDAARTSFAAEDDWPLLNSPEVSNSFGVARIPETFLIAPDGTVAHHVQGQVTAQGLIEVIESYE